MRATEKDINHVHQMGWAHLGIGTLRRGTSWGRAQGGGGGGGYSQWRGGFRGSEDLPGAAYSWGAIELTQPSPCPQRGPHRPTT